MIMDAWMICMSLKHDFRDVTKIDPFSFDSPKYGAFGWMKVEISSMELEEPILSFLNEPRVLEGGAGGFKYPLPRTGSWRNLGADYPPPTRGGLSALGGNLPQ